MTSRNYAAGLLAVMAGTSLSFAGSGPLRPVALTGTDGEFGPGRGAGIVFSGFSPAAGLGSPSISSNGAVAFLATIAGPGITSSSNTGVWAVRSPYPEAVAVEGDQVPGKDAGVVFDSFYTAPQMSDAKFTAFQASMRGTGITLSRNDALFTELGGGLHALIHERVTFAPTMPAVLFGDAMNADGMPWGSNNWVQSRTGATALRCYVDSSTGLFNEHFGVWTDRFGMIEKHYRGGDVVPNTDPSAAFYGSFNPRINSSGAIITMRLDTERSGSGLWTDRARSGIKALRAWERFTRSHGSAILRRARAQPSRVSRATTRSTRTGAWCFRQGCHRNPMGRAACGRMVALACCRR
jgi:hypothetical protein